MRELKCKIACLGLRVHFAVNAVQIAFFGWQSAQTDRASNCTIRAQTKPVVLLVPFDRVQAVVAGRTQEEIAFCKTESNAATQRKLTNAVVLRLIVEAALTRFELDACTFLVSRSVLVILQQSWLCVIRTIVRCIVIGRLTSPRAAAM